MKPMNLKNVLLLVLVFLTVIGISYGFSSGSEEKSKEPVTITFWSRFSERVPVFDAANRFADQSCVDGVIPLAKVRKGRARLLICGGRAGKVEENMPVLYENKVGKGHAYLLSPWCYPGHPAMRSLVSLLLKSFAEALHDKNLKVFAPAHVEYAVYPGPQGGYKLYLLNTDPDMTANVALEFKGRRSDVRLKAVQCKVWNTASRRVSAMA